jgi:hypothetical protein
MQLVHKWSHGFVDLQFSSTSIEELTAMLPSIPEGALLARAAKSASVRMETPPLSFADGAHAQGDKIRTALGIAVMLQGRGLEHNNVVQGRKKPAKSSTPDRPEQNA